MQAIKKSGLAIAVSTMLGVVFTPHVHAQISASASLTGLQFQLFDLNTSDDITPYANINGYLESALYGVPAEGETWGTTTYTALQNSSGSLLATANNGSVAVGAGTVSSNVQFTAEDINSPFHRQTYENYFYTLSGQDVNPGTGLLTNYQDVYTQQTTQVNLDGTGSHYSFQSREEEFGTTYDSFATVTLSPGTMLMVRGLATVSTRADSQSLVDALAQAGYSTYETSLTASVLASHVLELSRGETFTENAGGPGGGAYDNQFNRVALQGNTSFSNWGISGLPEDAPLMLREDSTSTELFTSYENFSDQDVTLTLLYEQVVRVNVQGTMYNQTVTRYWGDVVDVPTAPVIPEPGTWALMGLGLGAVALARRRQTLINTQAQA
jgi:PEP-CTERM motif